LAAYRKPARQLPPTRMRKLPQKLRLCVNLMSSDSKEPLLGLGLEAEHAPARIRSLANVAELRSIFEHGREDRDCTVEFAFAHVRAIVAPAHNVRFANKVSRIFPKRGSKSQLIASRLRFWVDPFHCRAQSVQNSSE